ncbi:MAG: acyl-CoA carboxylase subunit beta [Bacteriovoracaceae bacterium]
MDHFGTWQGLEKRAELGGGQARIDKQHAQKKYTARERIQRLLDPGSFVEFDKLVLPEGEKSFEADGVGDGVVTGIGEINGQKVALYSQDFTVKGGSLGHAHAKKICKIMDFALNNRIPIIGLNDSGGARIQEGVESLVGYAEIFQRNVSASGVVPQVTLILGPCAGGAVYSPALTDFIFMVSNTSHMFVTGPDVIKSVTHEQVTKEDLGGAKTHSEKSGLAHFHCKDEDDCFERVRELMIFLPNSSFEYTKKKYNSDSVLRKTQEIDDLIPSNSKQPYDMKAVISSIIDDGHFLEVQSEYAQNIIIGFASVGGMKVGIVANQPMHLAGVLDIDASVKAARFVRFCDAYDIPILSLVDVPGFLPGTEQEYSGIIRHGAKLIYAYAEATIPLITLITRKAYGGAYIVMASKFLRADVNLAYPEAEIAVMGAEGAVNILKRSELSKLEGDDLEKRRKELVDEYNDEYSNPFKAASKGFLDEIIRPEDTRSRIYQYLKMMRRKDILVHKRKHGNIPL